MERRIGLRVATWAASVGMWFGVASGQQLDFLDAFRMRSAPVVRPDFDVATGRVNQLATLCDSGHGTSFWLLSADTDKIVRVFRVIPGRGGAAEMRLFDKLRWPIADRTWGAVSAVCCAEYSRDSRWCAFSGAGIPLGTVAVVRPDAGFALSVVGPPNLNLKWSAVEALAFHPKDPVLAVLYAAWVNNNQASGAIAFYDIATCSWKKRIWRTEIREGTFLSFSLDGTHLLAANSDLMELFRYEKQREPTLKNLLTWKPPGAIAGVGWINDQTYVIGTKLHGLIRSGEEPMLTLENAYDNDLAYEVWKGPDETTLTPLRRGKIHPGDSERFELTEDSATLWLELTSPSVKRVRVSELSKKHGRYLVVIPGDGRPNILTPRITHLATSPVSSFVAISVISPVDSSLEEVRLTTGMRASRINLTEPRFSHGVNSITFSPQGRYLAAAGLVEHQLDQRSPSCLTLEYRVWSTKDGKLLCRYPQNNTENLGFPIANPVHAVINDHPAIAFGSYRNTHGNIYTDKAKLQLVPNPHSAISLSLPPHRAELTLQSVTLLGDSYQQQWYLTTLGGNGSFEEFQFGLENARDPPEVLSPFPPTDSFTRKPLAAVSFRLQGHNLAAIAYVRSILIWDVDRLRQGDAPVRGFTGHEFPATSLTFGQWDHVPSIISASVDGTMRVWSLEGLEFDPARRNQLDIDLRETEGDLSISRVGANGCGRFDGFAEGQVIDSVATFDFLSFKRVPVPRSQWKQKVEHAVPGEALLVTLKNHATLLTLALHKEIYAIAPLLNGHWLLWTPTGYFLASEESAQNLAPGEEAQKVLPYFGVHRNSSVGAGAIVRYFRADLEPTFIEDFDLSGMLAGPKNGELSGNQKWRLEQRQETCRRLLQELKPIPSGPAPSIVTISQITTAIANPSDENEVTVLEEPKDLAVQFDVKRYADEKIQHVEVWCNNCLIWQQDFDGSQPTVSSDKPIPIPASNLRRGQSNLIGVLAFSQYPPASPSLRRGVDGRLQTRVTGEDFRAVYVSKPPETRKLHYLGVGVTKFANALTRAKLSELESPANDAYAIGRELMVSVQQQNQYTAGKMICLVDKDDVEYDTTDENIDWREPTHEKTLNALHEIVSAASADDLICVYLSGHGTSKGVWKTQRPAKARSDKAFYFVVKDTEATGRVGEVYAETAVAKQELYAILNTCPCPVLFFIDACKSGAGKPASNRIFREHGELPIGPEILVSSLPSQDSWEYHKLRRVSENGKWVGHGIFAAAILEALTGQRWTAGNTTSSVRMETMSESEVRQNLDTREQDGLLSVEELEAYVMHRVPELLSEVCKLTQDRNAKQNPQPLPSRVFDSRQVRLSLPHPENN